MPADEDVRIAVDSFNRFRRPDVEAKVIEVKNSTATVEFTARENPENYVGYFREKLEDCCGASVKVASIKKNGSLCASFVIEKDYTDGGDSTEKALAIIDKYYEGTKVQFGTEN